MRKLQKQATRDKVLAAARALFEEVGYETTTVRMIADRAGVATGSVFTTFAGKTDILLAVVGERLEQLNAEVERVEPALRGGVKDRLCTVLALFYEFQLRQPGLIMALAANMFAWPPSGPRFRRHDGLMGAMRRVLVRGVGSGEIASDTNLDLLHEMIFSTYIWNYQAACVEGLAYEALIDRLDSQLDIILKGVAAA